MKVSISIVPDSQIGFKPMLSNWGFCKVHKQCLAMQLWFRSDQSNAMQCKVMQINAMQCTAVQFVCTSMHYIAGYNVAADEVHAVYSEENTEHLSLPPTYPLVAQNQNQRCLVSIPKLYFILHQVLFCSRNLNPRIRLKQKNKLQKNSIWGRRTVWW